MYRRDVSRGPVRSLYQGNVYKTQSTNENYIRLRPKVYISILRMLYGKIKNTNNNINSILSIDRQINKTIKPNVKAVFALLCQLYTE